MKAISLWEPYATFIALGIKNYETRSFKRSHRGDLLICAAKGGYSKFELNLILNQVNKLLRYPLNYITRDMLNPGKAVAIVNMVTCIPTIKTSKLNLTIAISYIVSDVSMSL